MFEHPSLFLELLPEYGLRLGVAALCGCVLGFERERKDKAAGLRTVMLITVGATLFMIVSDLIPVVTKGPEDVTRVDPSRIASQVVTGIGFLGGGAIIQSRGAVHGLTTAAVIWTAAGIGLCIGLGFPLLGGIVTVFILAVLVVLDPVGAWVSSFFGERHNLELVVPNDNLVLRRIENTLRQHDNRNAQVTVREQEENILKLHITYHTGASANQRLVDALASIEDVHGARYTTHEST